MMLLQSYDIYNGVALFQGSVIVGLVTGKHPAIEKACCTYPEKLSSKMEDNNVM